MRTKLPTLILGLGLLAFGAGGRASAQYYYAGYGGGLHDLYPHGHTTLTPLGPVYWYGSGLHDLSPHGHTAAPWAGVQSYNYTPFGPTVSYNGYPGYVDGTGYWYGGYQPWRFGRRFGRW